MAFELGWYYIYPGQSMGIELWFGEQGDDRGAQWIMAHPVGAGEGPTGALEVSGLTKYLYFTEEEFGPGSLVTYLGPYYRYGVTVTNTGNYAVYFLLQGGGTT